MRLQINLASRPYEDVRQFYVRWVPLLVVALVITGALAGQALFRLRDHRELKTQISDTQKHIQELDAQRAKAEAILNSPANASTTTESKFLNELIARKAFSWTQVMSDLEKILPPSVKVVNIQPKLDQDGKLEFNLSVQSSNRDQAIELVRRLETSPQFVSASVKSERENPGTNSIEFEISSLYSPKPPSGGQK